MIQLTGLTLTTFITGLNGGASVDATLLDILVSTAKTVLEGERPWMVLRKTDTSKTVTTSGTWQTAIDLSSITDFSEFYSDTPIQLFDGSAVVGFYQMVPWDRRLEFKDASNTCVYNANTKQLYLNGTVPVNGTLYIAYKSTSAEIDLASSSVAWPLFPLRFTPILGFYAIGIHKGAVDWDGIVKNMLPSNQAAVQALKDSMESWDSSLQGSSLQLNDPTQYGSNYPMGPRINRNA